MVSVAMSRKPTRAMTNSAATGKPASVAVSASGRAFVRLSGTGSSKVGAAV
jgi:hypothetical protein